MFGSVRKWWNRPCGGREVLALALPLFISTGAWSVLLFVDRMFLLWVSKEAMASAMPAGAAYWAMVCFPLGLAGYVNTFVAQYNGSDQPRRVAAALWQGMRVGVYATPLFLLAIPLAPWLFGWAGHSQQVLAYETVYFQWLAAAAGPAVITSAQAAYFTGRGKTVVVDLI